MNRQVIHRRNRAGIILPYSVEQMGSIRTGGIPLQFVVLCPQSEAEPGVKRQLLKITSQGLCSFADEEEAYLAINAFWNSLHPSDSERISRLQSRIAEVRQKRFHKGVVYNVIVNDLALEVPIEKTNSQNGKGWSIHELPDRDTGSSTPYFCFWQENLFGNSATGPILVALEPLYGYPKPYFKLTIIEESSARGFASIGEAAMSINRFVETLISRRLTRPVACDLGQVRHQTWKILRMSQLIDSFPCSMAVDSITNNHKVTLEVFRIARLLNAEFGFQESALGPGDRFESRKRKYVARSTT